jgi:hypothetical protein
MTQEINISNEFTLYSDGRLYNKETNKFRKWIHNNKGYLTIRIPINGEYRSVGQHRLLAESFIPNPENKTEVNHKNGIKNDNRLENLEWVTRSENIKHAFATGLIKAPRCYKKIVDTVTNIVYKSVIEAAGINKISPSHLTNMLAGRSKNKTNLKYYKI